MDVIGKMRLENCLPVVKEERGDDNIESPPQFEIIQML
jgi:hypothetical protein